MSERGGGESEDCDLRCTRGGGGGGGGGAVMLVNLGSYPKDTVADCLLVGDDK